MTAQWMPITKALRRADIMFRCVHHAGEEADPAFPVNYNCIVMRSRKQKHVDDMGSAEDMSEA